jgi:plastocyanin
MATATQSPPTSAAASARPRRYSALDIAVLITLGVCAVLYAIPTLLSGHIIPPTYFAIAWAVTTVVVATGWRWAAGLSLLISAASLIFTLAPGQYPFWAITHPGDSNGSFFPISATVPLLAIAAIASGLKLARLLRRQPITSPGWFAPAVTALIGLGIGALLIGSFAGPSAGGAGAAQAGTETVHLGATAFSPDIVAVHKGDMLALVGDSPTPHIIANGSWNSDNNKTLPGTEPGAPVVNNITVNNTTIKVGPFTTPGTYHLYCSVHPGMNLTVIVQ